MKPNKKLLTFQEKVQPLSKDEQGLLKGGFTEVGTIDPSPRKLRNTGCTNGNCPSNAVNKEECSNTNCTIKCKCGSNNGGSIDDPGAFLNTLCEGGGNLPFFPGFNLC